MYASATPARTLCKSAGLASGIDMFFFSLLMCIVHEIVASYICTLSTYISVFCFDENQIIFPLYVFAFFCNALSSKFRIAVPCFGRESMSSHFAFMSCFLDPKRSMCWFPIAVMTPIFGLTIFVRAFISPSLYAPISAMYMSVSFFICSSTS